MKNIDDKNLLLILSLVTSVKKPGVVCRCGAIIPEDEITYWTDYWNEDCGVVITQCPNCEAYYETSRPEEWDSKSDAVQYLANYIAGR